LLLSRGKGNFGAGDGRDFGRVGHDRIRMTALGGIVRLRQPTSHPRASVVEPLLASPPAALGRRDDPILRRQPEPHAPIRRAGTPRRAGRCRRHQGKKDSTQMHSGCTQSTRMVLRPAWSFTATIARSDLMSRAGAAVHVPSACICVHPRASELDLACFITAAPGPREPGSRAHRQNPMHQFTRLPPRGRRPTSSRRCQNPMHQFSPPFRQDPMPSGQHSMPSGVTPHAKRATPRAHRGNTPCQAGNTPCPAG
jgi:hypothetical protein